MLFMNHKATNDVIGMYFAFNHVLSTMFSNLNACWQVVPCNRPYAEFI